MKKKIYIVPIADLVVIDGNADLLDDVGITGGSKGINAEDTWAKGTVFDSDEEAGSTADNESNDWFNDSKSGW